MTSRCVGLGLKSRKLISKLVALQDLISRFVQSGQDNKSYGRKLYYLGMSWSHFCAPDLSCFIISICQSESLSDTCISTLHTTLSQLTLSFTKLMQMQTCLETIGQNIAYGSGHPYCYFHCSMWF